MDEWGRVEKKVKNETANHKVKFNGFKASEENKNVISWHVLFILFLFSYYNIG